MCLLSAPLVATPRIQKARVKVQSTNTFVAKYFIQLHEKETECVRTVLMVTTAKQCCLSITLAMSVARHDSLLIRCVIRKAT